MQCDVGADSTGMINPSVWTSGYGHQKITLEIVQQMVTNKKINLIFTKKRQHFLSGNDFESILLVFGTTAKYRFSTARFGISTAKFGISTRGPRWDHAPPQLCF